MATALLDLLSRQPNISKPNSQVILNAQIMVVPYDR